MKNNVLRILSLIALPVLFITFFFILTGFSHGPTCWIGLVFIILALILYIATPFFLPKSKNTYLFGVTTNVFTIAYMIANMFAGIVFMIADFDFWEIAMFTELAFLAAYFVMFIKVHMANTETARNENIKQENINQLRTLITKSRVIFNNAQSTEARSLAKKVYEELDTCPLKRTLETDSLDEAISYNLDQLNRAVLTDDIDAVKVMSDKIVQLAKNRKAIF